MYALPASLKPHEAVLRAAGRRAARERIAMVAALHAVRREGDPTPSDPRGSPAAAEESSAPLSEKEMVSRILSNVLRDGDVDLASAESAANGTRRRPRSARKNRARVGASRFAPAPGRCITHSSNATAATLPIETNVPSGIGYSD